MGRGRGKGKKSTIVSHDDGSGGEELLPAYKRRGRPQKPLKDEIDEEEIEMVEEEEEEGDLMKPTILSKEVKGPKKRKKYPQLKADSDSIMEENDTSIGANIEESTGSIGYRQNGSRRKSKPRRAAEAGVECK